LGRMRRLVRTEYRIQERGEFKIGEMVKKGRIKNSKGSLI